MIAILIDIIVVASVVVTSVWIARRLEDDFGVEIGGTSLALLIVTMILCLDFSNAIVIRAVMESKVENLESRIERIESARKQDAIDSGTVVPLSADADIHHAEVDGFY